MGTVIFLILLSICAAFVDRREMAPALMFVAIAHVFFFSVSGLSSPTLILQLSMLAEMVTVILLYSVRGCVRSNLLQMLLPLSIIAIPMHYYGTWLSHRGLPLDNYNDLVNVYYIMVLLMFLSVSTWITKLIRFVTERMKKDGSIIKPINLLREHDSKHKII